MLVVVVVVVGKGMALSRGEAMEIGGGGGVEGGGQTTLVYLISPPPFFSTRQTLRICCCFDRMYSGSAMRPAAGKKAKQHGKRPSVGAGKKRGGYV